MKKKITKWTASIEEVDIETVVEDFFDGYYDLKDWEETEEYLDSYIGEFTEISDKEENELRCKIRQEFDKKVAESISAEKEKIRNRESILEYLDCFTEYVDEGDVGFLLSTEEILDLILENGNK